MRLSVHPSFVFFRSKAGSGSSQIPSFSSSFSCFAAHFLEQVDLACPNNIFFTSFGQTYLMSTLTRPSKIRCVPLRPCYVQVAGFEPDSSSKSSHFFPHQHLKNLLHPRFFSLCAPVADPNSFCPGLGGCDRESSSLHFQGRTLSRKERAKLTPSSLLLSSILIFLSRALHVLAGTIPTRNNFLTPTFMYLFWKALFFLMSENLTLHFFLLASSSTPNLFCSGSQVHPKRFHTVCHRHSFFLDALTAARPPKSDTKQSSYSFLPLFRRLHSSCRACAPLDGWTPKSQRVHTCPEQDVKLLSWPSR